MPNNRPLKGAWFRALVSLLVFPLFIYADSDLLHSLELEIAAKHSFVWKMAYADALEEHSLELLDKINETSPRHLLEELKAQRESILARATFIRLQMAIHYPFKNPSWASRLFWRASAIDYEKLEKEANALLVKYEAQWLPKDCPRGNGIAYEWEDGFVKTVVISEEAFPQFLKILREIPTLRSYRVVPNVIGERVPLDPYPVLFQSYLEGAPSGMNILLESGDFSRVYHFLWDNQDLIVRNQRLKQILVDAYDYGTWRRRDSYSAKYEHPYIGEALIGEFIVNHCKLYSQRAAFWVLKRKIQEFWYMSHTPVDLKKWERNEDLEVLVLAFNDFRRAGHTDRAVQLVTIMETRFDRAHLLRTLKRFRKMPRDLKAVAYFLLRGFKREGFFNGVPTNCGDILAAAVMKGVFKNSPRS